MQKGKNINIAIDGYSACGKSTLAQGLARSLRFDYVDSGAMYRAVTLYAIRLYISEENIFDIIPLLKNISIECRWTLQGNLTFLNGEDVTDLIRSPEVQNLVSQISTIPEVRSFLVNQQKQMAKNGNVVMDGRDIGSKVIPDAELKIFMTADMDIRVQRRYNELMSKGILVTKAEIKENLELRDHIDSTREDSPLICPLDAKTLDNSFLNQQDQLSIALQWAHTAISSNSN